jgi:hypothetical protein
MNFDELNDATGFANGDLFKSETEVRGYFTVGTMVSSFPSYAENPPNQETLDEYAEAVISNRWHCAF